MRPLPHQRLGVNIDHVATVRNARGTPTPDPLRAAQLAAKAGADGITAHLREDRRHIVDADIARLMDAIELPLNFEMAATEEMVAIALRHRPHAACIVPEKREERTTEGGLDAAGQHNHLKPLVARLRRRRHPRLAVHRGRSAPARDGGAARRAGGRAAHRPLLRDRRRRAPGRTSAHPEGRRVLPAARPRMPRRPRPELRRMSAPIAAIPKVRELNIGHFLIGEAIFVGLEPAIREMRRLMDAARAERPRDPGHRQRPLRHQADREVPGALRRSLRAAHLHRGRAEALEGRATRAASYAKRFAAKEACAKALGTGLRRGVFWRDMGVINQRGGKPTMALTGGAARPPGTRSRRPECRRKST